MVERYGEATTVRAFDGDPDRLTEMDAVVAYLQILGRLTDAAFEPIGRAGGIAMEVSHDESRFSRSRSASST